MDSARPRSRTPNEPAVRPVRLGAIFRTFFAAGAISFGGGVVAYLREYVVHQQKWMDDEAFLDALELGETLPGLNSVAQEQTPSLSADVRYIVFVSERIAGEGERDIYLYDRQTSKLLPTPGLNSRMTAPASGLKAW